MRGLNKQENNRKTNNRQKNPRIRREFYSFFFNLDRVSGKRPVKIWKCLHDRY